MLRKNFIVVEKVYQNPRHYGLTIVLSQHHEVGGEVYADGGFEMPLMSFNALLDRKYDDEPAAGSQFIIAMFSADRIVA